MALEVVLLEEGASITDSVVNARLFGGEVFDEGHTRTFYTEVLEECFMRK